MKRTFLFIFGFFFTLSTWAGSAYQLNEGDTLHISVWGEERLRQETRILPDGSISFPLVGNIQVGGLTAPQVERAIAEGISDFIPEPDVSVLVLDTEGNRIYVLGKVANPGSFVMSSPLSVMQALSLAGGLTTFADENDILILRHSAAEQSQLEVHYNDILSGKNLSTNHELEAGDTILVP
jgi:polysaccharide export outer membrane protein